MSIISHFKQIELNADQQNAVEKIEIFLNSDNDVFILRGYAGSGKTTLLQGLLSYLNAIEKKHQLMAPTGRAAKVINQKTSANSTTIHRGIYSFDKMVEVDDEDKDSAILYYFKIKDNLNIHDAVLIIDEASMISDISNHNEIIRFGSGFLLKDLIEYSRIKLDSTNTKIIFIGDPAQLAPIGMNTSPALDENHLKGNYGLSVDMAEIKTVMRQKEDNGILNASTLIRNSMLSGYFNDFDLRSNNKDIFNISFKDFLNEYNNSGSSKIVISYSNKTALDINNLIRKNKYGSDLPVQVGDILISGSNNYKEQLLNGEFVIVTNVADITVQRDVTFNVKGKGSITITLRWRAVELIVPDDDNRLVSGYLLENYLYGDNNLDSIEQQALLVDFKKRNPELKPKSDEFLDAMRNDSYYNPLRLKYGYAVTCHKAQGGEWEKAFIFWDYAVKDGFNFYEAPHEKSGKTNTNFFRWSYTAVTRASQKIFCINPPYFNSFSSMVFISDSVKDSIKELTGEETSIEDVIIDNELLSFLSDIGAKDEHMLIQDNLIKIRHIANPNEIVLKAFERKGYEVRYYFKKGEETAAVKDYFNSSHVFKNNFMPIASGTNSNSFLDEVLQILKKPVNINICRTDANVILDKISFEYEVEEKYPFLKALFDRLDDECNNLGVQIDDIKHNQYHERYTFTRRNEIAELCFEYKQNGFFGRVLPVTSKCKGLKLLKDLENIIVNIKCSNHVV